MDIKDLVKKYEVIRHSPQWREYNESQLRIDFLDPMFESLGWDIKKERFDKL